MRIRFEYTGKLRTGDLIKIEGDKMTVKEDGSKHVKTFYLGRANSIETGNYIPAAPAYTRAELLAQIEKEAKEWAKNLSFKDEPLRLVLAALYVAVPSNIKAKEEEAVTYYMEEN